MLIRPGREDLRVIGASLCRVVTVVGAAMLIPALVAVARREWNELTALVVSAAIAVAVGRVGESALRVTTPHTWTHGMVTVGFGWPLAACVAAVPLYLVGHTGGYLDATFEAMSGLTSTGLTLTQDLDHLPVSLNLWRHLLQFLGGQSFVVVVLTVFTVSATRAGAPFVGELRDTRLLPSTTRTIRFILLVSTTAVLIGTAALVVTGTAAGLAPVRAFHHGLALSLSAVNTGGFAPTSTSAGYYHSVPVEAVLIVLMLTGALSYGIHYQLWRGHRRELRSNLEPRTFAASLVTLLVVTYVGLGRSGAYTDTWPMFRRGFFTLVSAHTTTGLTTTDPRVVVTDWGLIVPAALVAAMAIGGMASSPAGGIKSLRVGITAKGVAGEVRRVLLPESALVVTTYNQQQQRHILRDGQVRAASTVLLLFLFTYLMGGIVTLFATDVDFTSAMFESTSAAANGGLSVGITDPSAPTLIKVVLLVQMWLGRLEFLAGLSIFGYAVALVRGRT